MYIICILKQFSERGGSIGSPRWPEGSLIKAKIYLQRRVPADPRGEDKWHVVETIT